MQGWQQSSHPIAAAAAASSTPLQQRHQII
jgi:hypothetical protein